MCLWPFFQTTRMILKTTPPISVIISAKKRNKPATTTATYISNRVRFLFSIPLWLAARAQPTVASF